MHRLLITALLITFTTPIWAIQSRIDVSEHPAPTTQQAPTQRHAQALKHITLPAPPAIQLDAKAWVLMDYQTGQVLAQKDDTAHLPPASLTKLMTAYVILQAIHHGTIKLDDKVRISAKAAGTGGSKMFLKPGEQVSVENLMKGMIIQSGNDATVALAEHVAGSETAFATMMNQIAQQLHMTNSHFTNANGLPNPDQYVSALDMAHLAQALIQHFPKQYAWYSEKSFTWNGITQRSRNRLLWRNANVDGLKTGYTKAAQYCLVASAKQPQQRLIGVILGAPSSAARADEMQRLLTYGFRFYENRTLYTPGQVVETTAIKNGKSKTIALTVQQPVVVTLPRGHFSQVKAKVTLPTQPTAPIKAGSVLGTLHVMLGDKTLLTRPVIAKDQVAKGSLIDTIKHWF